MNIGKVFVIEMIIIVLIAGGIGYWRYEQNVTLENLAVTFAAKEKKVAVYRKKVNSISNLEEKKSSLDVRRNEIDVAVPLEGNQDSTDIMTIIDSIKQDVENSSRAAIPLVLIKSGEVSGLEKIVDKKKKRDAKEYKPVTIKLTILSTWLGTLRFIDLLEKDAQIFKLVSLKGTSGNDKPFGDKEEVAFEEMIKKSPFDYDSYGGEKTLIIETYHMLEKASKK